MITRAFRPFAVALCLIAVPLAAGLLFAQPQGNQALTGPTNADVVYGVEDGQNLLLDIYRPPTTGLHPALVMIHGGGWAAGDKSGDKDIATNLAGRVGFVCFSINYRLAPKYPYPAAVLDSARAVRWVRAHAADYGVDPNRVAAWGGSAGGHLVLMLGVIKPDDFQTPDDPNKALSAKVQCVVDLFGPSDLTRPMEEWPPAALPIAYNFMGCKPDEAPDKWAEASPITHVTKDASPTLLIHGEKDELVPLHQSELMKAALDKVGVENQLIVVKNAGHGFKGADDGEVQQALTRAVIWLMGHARAKG